MNGLRSRVPAHAAGRTMLDWLTERFTYFDAPGWRHEIAAGRVHRNGEQANTADTLREGDAILYRPPIAARRAPAPPIAILHEDDDLIAVDKPPGRVAHREGAFADNTFLLDLEAQVGARAPLHLVHRLDRDTSGVLLLARHAGAVAAMQQQFAEGAAAKQYAAVVTGRVEREQVTIDAPIGPAAGSAVAARRAVVPMGSPRARTARTEITVVERFGAHTLLAVRPRSGRTHQIRVHLAHAGHPIAFDPLYGRSDDEYLAWVRMRKAGSAPRTRTLLHAASLSLRHPSTNALLHFAAPWPADFAAFVAATRTAE